jgi:uncharacterized membrane protein
MLIFVLFIILFLLLGLVGDERGVTSLFTIAMNLIVFVFSMNLMMNTKNIILVTCIATLLFLGITLFMQNGWNKKTIASGISIIIVLIGIGILAAIVVNVGSVGGHGELYIYDEEVAFLESQIGFDSYHLMIASVIIGILGAITDTALSVSSSMYEVFQHNPSISKQEIFLSGSRVGWDILGTTFSTLIVAEIGQAYFLWVIFARNRYTIGMLLNSKSFLQETFLLVVAALGCLLVIPLTAKVAAEVFFLKKQNINTGN